MKKITKKQAIQLLESKQNILLASWFKPLNECKNIILERYERVENNYKNNNNVFYRICKNIQSNAIQFNNNSWLYFNEFNECYLLNSWLILTSENHTFIYRLV